MSSLLNEMLANTLDLYTHAKQAHWNVRGPQFQAVHELFDRVSQAALDAADEVAERAGQLGAEVSGTLVEASKATTLPPYGLHIAGIEAHIKAVTKSMGAYCEANRKAIKKADDADDPLTADLFTQSGRKLEELMWFVESHLVPSSTDEGDSNSSSRSKAGNGNGAKETRR
jgi:starvation-inducible DNA-binding protein